MQVIQSIDTNILLFVQESVRSGSLDAVMIFFSAIGTYGAVWIAAALIMVLTKKYRHTGILLLVCLAVCWALNDVVLKNLVQRPRPYIALPELQVLVPLHSDFSFPSGHTSTSFAAAYLITRAMGKRWAWVYAPAALIAASRIYIGMHYPTDVLAGAVFGTFIAAVTYAFAARRFFRDKDDQI